MSILEISLAASWAESPISITVDDKLELVWKGKFHLGLAVSTLETIKDLLVLQGAAEALPKCAFIANGWFDYSDFNGPQFKTYLLRNWLTIG